MLDPGNLTVCTTNQRTVLPVPRFDLKDTKRASRATMACIVVIFIRQSYELDATRRVTQLLPSFVHRH
jgi:hypothetical protein